MIVKSFGCSFIYGSELSDDFADKKHLPSQVSWPALIAQRRGYQYQCFAVPGSGNSQIAESVLCQAVDTATSLFVVGWTWIDRFSHVDAATDKWKTIVPSDNSEIAQFYYRHLHSQYQDKLNTLMCIKLTIDALKQQGHNFVMTYQDELIFETKWHTTPAVSELQNYIRPYLTAFEGQTFLEWSRLHGYPISALCHPLDLAHAAAADYLINHNLV
jgi:hypothetical protein